MMEYDFTFDGEKKTVKLDKAKNGDGKAVIGERQIAFESSRISPNSYSIIVDGKSRVVYAAESKNAIYVHLDGRIVKFDKADDNQNNFAGEAGVFGAKDQVSTPMPGKIVKILVKEGETVSLKQALVIVESMKMENKIVSPSDAEIKSIHFAEGDLVEPGQAIIKLIPKE